MKLTEDVALSRRVILTACPAEALLSEITLAWAGKVIFSASTVAITDWAANVRHRTKPPARPKSSAKAMKWPLENEILG
jgi:hypothetical protein